MMNKSNNRIMVICVGSFATIDCEPRQARKGATVTVDSGAEILLAWIAANMQYQLNINSICHIRF